MKKIGIFYGSTTGATESLARAIAEKLEVASSAIHDVTSISDSLINDYEVLLLGSSTWGDGELQDDWYDGVQILASMDLSDKIIGFFGCGDSDSYSDTFCDAIGILYNDLKSTGCKFCGKFPVEGYTFDNSVAVVDGSFVGLAIDDMNEEGETEGRIDRWIEILKNDCVV